MEAVQGGINLPAFQHSNLSEDNLLSDKKPRQLKELLRGNLGSQGRIVLYVLNTHAIGRGNKIKHWYVLEEVPTIKEWSTPFDGDVLGVTGRCIRDKKECCDQRCLSKVLRDAAYKPVPLRDEDGKPLCFTFSEK